MKLVSSFGLPDVHVMRTRDSDGNIVAWCSGVFGKLPDGNAEDLLDDIQAARLCVRCKRALKEAGIPAPTRQAHTWNSLEASE